MSGHSLYQRFIEARTPTGDSLKLSERNVYLLPTPFGWGFLLFCGVLLLLAINFENSLVYLLTFWLIGIFIVSIVMTWSNLIGLELLAAPANPIFVGEEAGFPITLRSQGGAHYAFTFLYGDRYQTADLPRGEERTIMLYQVGERRGEILLPRIRIESSYPLGLIRAWSFIRFEQRALCYPAPKESFEYAKGAGAAEIGDAASMEMENFTRGVDDYVGLSQYQAGDSLRHIHWQAYAKGEGLYVKQFSEEQQEELWIDYRKISGDFEERLAKMCYLLLMAEEKGARYGLRIGNESIDPASGESHLTRCLTHLALA